MNEEVLVNEAFRGQTITGQQRYATEIARRLRHRPGFRGVGPPRGWPAGPLPAWAWSQTALPARAGRRVVLSMTARAPLVSRHHVLVVHDLFVLTDPHWFAPRYVAGHAPLLRRQLRSAAALVAVSEPVAAQVRAQVDAPVVVAPNAPSAIFREPPAGSEAIEAPARHGLVPGSYLLGVGSADPRKNLRRLIRAYATLPPEQRRHHPLVLVGGRFAFAAAQPATETWPDGVRHLGYVSDDELRELYRGACAVVMPSEAEGFGLPLVEAAAAGARALVVSDLPVFRWICGPSAHYVDPLSVIDLADGLRRALAGQVPRPQIAPGRFDWDRSAAIVAELCLAVAAGARR